MQSDSKGSDQGTIGSQELLCLVTGETELAGESSSIGCEQRRIDRRINERRICDRLAMSLNEQYRILFEYSGDAIYLFDKDLELVIANVAAYEHLGYPNLESLPKYFDRLFTCLKTETKEELISRIGHGKDLRQDAKQRRKDGGVVDVEIRIRRIEQDGIPFVLCTSRDISHRKRIEEHLMSANERFYKVLDGIHAVIFVVDMQDDALLFMNRHIEDSVQCQIDTIIGRKCWEVLRLPSRCEHCYMGDLLDGDGNPNGVITQERFIDLLNKWYRVSSQAIEWIDGRLVSLGIAVDITDLKIAEKSLKEARQESDRLNRAKTDFLSMISHEIRTPLNGVLGFLTFLTMTDLCEKQAEYVGIALQSGERMLELVNEILDIAKIETGIIELSMGEFNPQKTVSDVINMLKPLSMMNGNQMIALIDENVPARILGDEEKLRRVLINLMNNAIKFTHEGMITLRITKMTHSDQSLLLKFEVIDIGIGVPEEKAERIFLPFMQADAEVKGKYGGTGLGLSICKDLVKLFNGDIGVESKPGKGSKFWFTGSFGIPESA